MILHEVTGHIKGIIPENHKVLIGHRELTEQKVKIHADRISDILPNNTFKAIDIYLGSPDQGVGKTFEIIALLVCSDDLDRLRLKDGDNPLNFLPKHITKSVTHVKRTW